MKPVKEVNFLSNINIANITDSFNIDVGDILSGNNLLNNNTLLSGILSNNSILDGGILNGNDVDISPSIDLGLGDILPVNILSNNIASPFQLVGDVLSNTGDLSVLSNIANLDVGGVTTVVTDAVDVLSNLNVDILTHPTAIVGDLLNTTAIISDVLNPTSVIGDVLSPTAVVSDILNVTSIVSDVLNPTAVLTDVLDVPVVANVANVVAPITTALDADFLNTDITGDVLSNITSIVDSDIGANLVGAVTDLDVSNVGNVLNDLTSVIGADTDLIGAVTNLDISNITSNLLSNLTSNLGLGQLGPGIDLGDVGALISAQAVTDLIPLSGINTLVDQIDLFGGIDADAA